MRKSTFFILNAFLLISVNQAHAGFFSPFYLPMLFVRYIGSFLHTRPSIDKIITKEFELMKNIALKSQEEAIAQHRVLKKQVQQIGQEITTINNRFGDHERLQNLKHAEFMRQMTEIEINLENGQKKLATSESQISKQINDFKAKISELKTEKTKLESEVTTQDRITTDKIDNLSRTMDKLQKEFATLISQHTAIADESKELRRTLGKCKEKMTYICSAIAFMQPKFIYFKQNENKAKKNTEIGRRLSVLVAQQNKSSEALSYTFVPRTIKNDNFNLMTRGLIKNT